VGEDGRKEPPMGWKGKGKVVGYLVIRGSLNIPLLVRSVSLITWEDKDKERKRNN
jgi:hypothetical protein